MCGALVVVLSMMGIGLEILLNVFPSKTAQLIYLYFSLFAAMLYIVCDTQYMTGDKSHALQIDDYILGSMTLYLDIIYLFMSLLLLL